MPPWRKVQFITQMASWSGSAVAPLFGSGERHVVLDPDWTKVRTPEEDAVVVVVVIAEGGRGVVMKVVGVPSRLGFVAAVAAVAGVFLP